MTITLDALKDAYLYLDGGRDFDVEVYLCRKTGRTLANDAFSDIYELPSDEYDPKQHIHLPDRNDLGLGVRLAKRFVAEHLPNAIDAVDDMFYRRGGWRNFKSLLERQGQLDNWYRYEDTALGEAL